MPAFRIGSPHMLRLRVPLPRALAGFILPGTPVFIPAAEDGADESAYHEMAVTSITAPKNRESAAHALITLPAGTKFAMGARHDLFLVTGQKSGLAVPRRALVTEPDMPGRNYVWLAERGAQNGAGRYKLRKIPVRTDFTGNSLAIVKDGVLKGDLVILNPDQSLHEPSSDPGSIPASVVLPLPVDPLQAHISREAAKNAPVISDLTCGQGAASGVKPGMQSCPAPSGIMP
jgi:hypothetical protein